VGGKGVVITEILHGLQDQEIAFFKEGNQMALKIARRA